MPALVVHGGPGWGCSAGMRRSFDPERHRIILFDQRNCGRSTPHASDPAADMSLNTSEHLIGDMLPTDTEPPIEDLLMSYSRLLEGADPDLRRQAATEWLVWEDTLISMERNGKPGQYSKRPEDASIAFVRICAHYFANDCFLDDGVLIREAGKLARIPAVLVQGRGDLGCPVITAWELARAWPGAELVVVEDSGHTGSSAMQDVLNTAGERLFGRITERTARHPTP
jgi:proline iminopeptidase